ncbi:MAG: hypothetical protein AMXMBFR23_03180 [Chloroflexota bacterium]
MDRSDAPAPRRRIAWRSFVAGAAAAALVAAGAAGTAALTGAVEVAGDASERDRLAAQVRDTTEALARAEASRARAVSEAARMEHERNEARGEWAAAAAQLQAVTDERDTLVMELDNAVNVIGVLTDRVREHEDAAVQRCLVSLVTLDVLGALECLSLPPR